MSEEKRNNVLKVYFDQLTADCPLCDGLIDENTPLILPKLPVIDYNCKPPCVSILLEDKRVKCPWCHSSLEVTVYYKERKDA